MFSKLEESLIVLDLGPTKRQQLVLEGSMVVRSQKPCCILKRVEELIRGTGKLILRSSSSQPHLVVEILRCFSAAWNEGC